MSTPLNNLPQLPTSHADVLLHESMAALEPLVRLLIAQGVTYPQVTLALKRVFFDAAHSELASRSAESPERITDSAISLLSGIHRKDVRALGDGSGDANHNRRASSFAAEVLARWSRDPAFRDDRGRPRALPLRSRATHELSFEHLTHSISKDFHARSVLDELQRLGLVDVDHGIVQLKPDALAPRREFATALHQLATNVRDHLASGEANLRASLRGDKPPFMHDAVVAAGLSAESAIELQQLARKLWNVMVRKIADTAVERIDADESRPPAERAQRVRFGSFYFNETEARVDEARRQTAQRDVVSSDSERSTAVSP